MNIHKYMTGAAVLSAALMLAACGEQGTQTASAPATGGASKATTDASGGQAWNMRLVAHHDLQGRSAYQPTIHKYGDKTILFVGHHEGKLPNPLTGQDEMNGMSVLDVTDVTKPQLLTHIPASDAEEESQHIQLCDGKELTGGDPNKTYLVRSNGQASHELWDATDPAQISFMRVISTTGTDPVSQLRQTHKNEWDCGTGLAFLVSSVDGWRSPRVLQIYDLNTPEKPRHVRDFHLWENAPGTDNKPVGGNGVHQSVLYGNRVFISYGSGADGVLQIVDLKKLVDGNPEPTRENLEYPEVTRVAMPSYWGGHTAKPVYGMKIADYADNGVGATRDILVLASEERDNECRLGRHPLFFLDITEETKPWGISSWQVPESEGEYCQKGGRFGPHSMHDSFNPAFHDKLLTVSYFNAGVRAVDFRDPFNPREVGFYIPATTDKTFPLCVERNGAKECKTAIQTNNVQIDDRGYLYLLDRSGTGLHIVELTGEPREIVGLK